MKAFVCFGSAIIATLFIIAIEARYCETCCNGAPCHVEPRP